MIVIIIILIVIAYLLLFNNGRSMIGSGESREDLPYRPVAECYLLYDDKIVAQPHDRYIMFPGGGIDEGESVIEAANRELMEEVGAVLDEPLLQITSIDWDWMPEWADTPKRKDRYKQFRGERVYFLFGRVRKFVKPTSTEGDAWKGDILADLDKLIELHAKLGKKDHPNTKCYRSTQYAMLQMLKLMNTSKK